MDGRQSTQPNKIMSCQGRLSNQKHSAAARRHRPPRLYSPTHEASRSHIRAGIAHGMLLPLSSSSYKGERNCSMFELNLECSHNFCHFGPEMLPIPASPPGPSVSFSKTVPGNLQDVVRIRQHESAEGLELGVSSLRGFLSTCGRKVSDPLSR